MNARIPEQSRLSHEVYRTFAENLDVPLDSQMPLETKYELYVSKLVYLENLMSQCFRGINKQGRAVDIEFSSEDLMKIQNSYRITKDLLRECIFMKLRTSFEGAAKLAVHSAWYRNDQISG